MHLGQKIVYIKMFGRYVCMNLSFLVIQMFLLPFYYVLEISVFLHASHVVPF